MKESFTLASNKESNNDIQSTHRQINKEGVKMHLKH